MFQTTNQLGMRNIECGGFPGTPVFFLAFYVMSNILSTWRDEETRQGTKCYDVIGFQGSTTIVGYCWTDAEKHEVTLPPIQP